MEEGAVGGLFEKELEDEISETLCRLNDDHKAKTAPKKRRRFSTRQLVVSAFAGGVVTVLAALGLYLLATCSECIAMLF